MSKIKNAKVIDDSKKFFLEVVDVVCLRCSGKRDFTKAGDLGFKSNDEADIVKVEESMCHPVFYRRSGTGEKFIGSIAHLVTFGIPYVLEKHLVEKHGLARRTKTKYARFANNFLEL